MTRGERKPDAAMTRARLCELLEAYGSEPARWPEHERAAAEALLGSDAEATRLLEQAAKLDGLLAFDAASALKASPALRARIAEVPIRHAQADERAGSFVFRHALSAAFAAALMVAFGVAAGAFSGGDAEDGSSVAEATRAEPAVEAGAEDDGWDDLTAIAFAEELGQEP